MPIITVSHHDQNRDRHYSFSATPDLQHLFPEGVKLDSEAVAFLVGHLNVVIATVAIGFGVKEDVVTITNFTSDGNWYGVCEFIEPQIVQAVQDSALRATGMMIAVG